MKQPKQPNQQLNHHHQQQYQLLPNPNTTQLQQHTPQESVPTIIKISLENTNLKTETWL